MKHQLMIQAIWAAGAVHLAIIGANVPLPGMLQVRDRLAPVPRFVRQIFCVHWIYILLVLAMFATLCFAFARDLAGATSIGRFLSGFIGAFWLLRIALQVLYYDRAVRREHPLLDALYLLALSVLVLVFGIATMQPIK
jgi:hypothetical protein